MSFRLASRITRWLAAVWRRSWKRNPVMAARVSADGEHRANVPPGRSAATLGSSNGSGIMRPRSTRHGEANRGTLTIACTQAFGLAPLASRPW
jgi:hypothetical protein